MARMRADYSNRSFSCGKPNSTWLENAVASFTGCVMARGFPSIYLAMFVGALSVGSADARSRSPQDSSLLTPIVNAAPTLTPFQHVRFCLRYPSDCKSNPAENDHIDLDAETSELLKRVNHSVNISIIPTRKSYGRNLGDGWTIAPDMGDCNETKGDIVMDDLTEVIRPWQSTDYHWLKIQSATDSKFWHEIKRPAIRRSVSQADRWVRLADR